MCWALKWAWRQLYLGWINSLGSSLSHSLGTLVASSLHGAMQKCSHPMQEVSPRVHHPSSKYLCWQTFVCWGYKRVLIKLRHSYNLEWQKSSFFSLGLITVVLCTFLYQMPHHKKVNKKAYTQVGRETRLQIDKITFRSVCNVAMVDKKW